MLWRYIEIKVKRMFYPNIYFFSEEEVVSAFKRSIYKKYDLNIRFDTIPEYYCDMYYFAFFGLQKGLFVPTDDNIKFFYFTRFKKNGFLFILLSIVLYRNCFFEFVFLVIKGFIAFYLIVDLIYIIFFIRKYIKIILKLPHNFIFTIFLIYINKFLNKLSNKLFKSNEKWYF